METRYYLHPGQTLANTKVKDRGQALHIVGNEWRRIEKHLDRNKDIQEALEKEETKRRLMDEGSKNMIKNWDNSLENIRHRKEEARLRRIEKIKDDRTKRFFELRAEQAEIRKHYIEKVKRQMFLDTGWARNVNSAFVTSEVIFEREKQIEFKNYIKKHEAEEAAEYAKKVKQDAQNEADEKAAYKRQLYEERQENGRFLRAVMAENETKARIIEETRIEKESLDNLKSKNEIAYIKRREVEQRAKEKRELNLDKQKYLKSIDDLKKQLKQEEKEMDDVLEIYQKAKFEIECLKKEKEAEKQEAIIARREYVASMVVAGEAAVIAAEEKNLKAAIAEREAIEVAKLKARAEYDANIRRERLQNRDDYVARKKEEDRRDAEIKKWEMVNRYKIAEFTKQYEENQKRELWENILKRRKELLDQKDDDDKRKKEAKDMDDCLLRVSYAGSDDQFFEYADEVLELAKRKGRNTYPIEKIILEYKKYNSLLPEGKKCTTCEHVKVEDKKSRSREIIKNSVKKKTCKCNIKK